MCFCFYSLLRKLSSLTRDSSNTLTLPSANSPWNSANFSFDGKIYFWRQSVELIDVILSLNSLSFRHLFLFNDKCNSITLQLTVCQHVRPCIELASTMCHPSSVELHHDIVGAFNVEVVPAADEVIDASPLLVPELAILATELVTLGLCNINGLDYPVAIFFLKPVLDSKGSTFSDHLRCQIESKYFVITRVNLMNSFSSLEN